MATKGLLRRGRSWYVRRAVPEKLRPVLGGRREIVRALHTRDHAEALRRRHAAMAEIEGELARAAAKLDPLPRAERYWRALQEASDDPLDAGVDGHTPRQDLLMQAADEAEEIAGEQGEAVAEQFVTLVRTGERTLAALREDWLAEVDGTLTERTLYQYRHDTKAMVGWLAERGYRVPSAVTRRVAAQAVREVFEQGDPSPKTVNRRLSGVSSWWRWLMREGHAEVNPWSLQTRSTKPQRGRTRGNPRKRRPMLPAEMVALLEASRRLPEASRYRDTLPDLIALAIGTGARLEEMCRLRRGDVVHGPGIVPGIQIWGGKTAAAERGVPLIPEVWAVVEARLARLEGEEWLFPELEASGPDGKRSESLTKAFTRFRRRVLGHDDVDFHSFRRSFATWLERAMARYPEVGDPVINELMGHAKGTLARRVYSGGLRDRDLVAAMGRLREVMEPEVLASISGNVHIAAATYGRERASCGTCGPRSPRSG